MLPAPTSCSCLRASGLPLRWQNDILRWNSKVLAHFRPLNYMAGLIIDSLATIILWPVDLCSKYTLKNQIDTVASRCLLSLLEVPLASSKCYEDHGSGRSRIVSRRNFVVWKVEHAFHCRRTASGFHHKLSEQMLCFVK